MNCKGSFCTRCKGQGDDQCLECEPNHYVKIRDVKSRSGSCEEKITSLRQYYDIYVSNKIDESKTKARQRKGSYTDPFAQLPDALVRARELAAPFLKNVQVTIHMFKGDHFVVENRFDAFNIYTEKNAFDMHLLNLELHIQPLLCNHTSRVVKNVDPLLCSQEHEVVTIYNKIRERMQFQVLALFKLVRIKVDAIDSILPFGHPCLSQHKRCCTANNATLQDANIKDYDPSSGINCKKHFEMLKLTDECHVGEPRTLFKFIANDDHKYYKQFKTNELMLDQSEITNFFFQMNSMINITKHGGRVLLTNSTFSQINICGAILKNKYFHNNIANFTDIDSAHLEPHEKEWIETVQDFQFRWHEHHEEYFYTGHSDTHEFPDTLISFDNVKFKMLNFHSRDIVAPLRPVSSENNMQYQGLVINFDSFWGNIVIRDSLFENNLFRYSSCDIIPRDVRARGKGAAPILAQPSLTNDFHYIHRHPDTKFDKVQIKSLINILNHTLELGMFHNTFVNNTGLKGIINIDRNPMRETAHLLVGNTFINNSALLDANVLNMRIRVNQTQLLATNYTARQDLACGGITLRFNNFSRSIGCKNTFGAMHIYCYDATHKSNSSKVRYAPEVDAQYFVGDLYDERLMAARPSELTRGARGRSYSYSKYKIRGVQPEDLNGRNNLLFLHGNEYHQNLAGAKRSVVQVEGFPIFECYNETYKGNENWFQLLFDELGFFSTYKKNASQ